MIKYISNKNFNDVVIAIIQHIIFGRVKKPVANKTSINNNSMH
jgi:hypothetical protein